ncbi:MAG: alpha/beta fold hydrolase [bacterium]
MPAVYINGFNMFYKEHGEGNVPVLFIHGFPLSADIWDEQINEIGAKTRVICPDLRGFGRTAFTDVSYSMELFASDLKSLIDTLNIKKIILAGLSMGGYIAFSFYKLFPSSVHAMVLLDTRAGSDTEEGKKNRVLLAQRARNGEKDRIADEWVEKLLAPETIKTKHHVVSKVREIILNTPSETIARVSLAMMERQDSTELLKDITCPTLVVVGEKDRLTPVEEARSMASRIKNAKLEVINNAGHLTSMEAPEQLNKVLLAFLSDLR